jgi:type I pullulanase
VDETTGGYNWGYDPKNYNVPEGSYSTDPYNGAVRVNEFKQMVQSLHNNGIGVIMDVVYNHVADAGQFCFNQIVPGYFSRIHDDGSYQSNSGCGNDTASERSMVSKYIVDSVLYWATEYHIDGFRWDLVGLVDYETINAVMAAVHEVNPDIIFYGEGWDMCSWTTKDGYTDKMTIQGNADKVNNGDDVFAFFNDTVRNVLHGGVFGHEAKGFIGDVNVDGSMYNTLVESFKGASAWGTKGTVCPSPLQTVNYASCHDNYTLIDNITLDSPEATREQHVAMNNLAAAYYMTAQGIPFIHAGEEMLRSKPDASQETGYNHNTYAAGDEINSIKWSALANEEVANTSKYYAGLIDFRMAHPALRQTDVDAINNSVKAYDTGDNGVLAFTIDGTNVGDGELFIVFNSRKNEYAVTLPEGNWTAYVMGDKAGTEVLANLEGTVYVDAISTLVLVKEEKAQESLKGDSFTLSFENEIIVNMYFNANGIADAEQMGLLVWNEQPDSAQAQADATYTDVLFDPVTNRYMASTDGIAAKEMGDLRYYAAFAKLADGSYVYTDVYAYSPKVYATNKLANSESEELKVLCVAMLNYGAAAQEYFGYKTDALMNADLTQEQQAMVEAYNDSMVAPLAAVDPDKAGEFAVAQGFGRKSATVSFNGSFDINFYFAANQTLPEGAVTFYAWDSASDVLTADNAVVTASMTLDPNGRYFAQLGDIAAKEINKTVYVCGVYEIDGQLYSTGVIAYSLGQYCKSLANKDASSMQALAAATAVYGYYADGYLG